MLKMNAPKHTPGPWHVVHNGHYYLINVPWKDGVDVDQYCPSICSVFKEGNDGIKAVDNIHLIAAAPELYDVLVQLYSMVVNEIPVGMSKYVWETLEKARGER